MLLVSFIEHLTYSYPDYLKYHFVGSAHRKLPDPHSLPMSQDRGLRMSYMSNALLLLLGTIGHLLAFWSVFWTRRLDRCISSS